MGGWVLFTEWVEGAGEEGHHGGWNAPADQDWFKTLGLVRAGGLQVDAAYLRHETIGTTDEDDEDEP